MTEYFQVLFFCHFRVNTTRSRPWLFICIANTVLLYIEKLTDIYRCHYMFFLSIIYFRIIVGITDRKIFHRICWRCLVYFGRIIFLFKQVPFYMNEFTPESLKGINGTLVGTLASTGAFIAFLLGFG